MAYVKLCNFIEVYRIRQNGEEEISDRYQNYAPGQEIPYNATPGYKYLSFIYQGAAKNRTGDNLEAALVLSVNALSQDAARSAVMKRKHVRVHSVVIESGYNPVTRTLSTEEWLAATMTYDYDTLEVLANHEIVGAGGCSPQAELEENLVGLDEKEDWEAIEHAIELSMKYMTGLDGVYALLDLFSKDDLAVWFPLLSVPLVPC